MGLSEDNAINIEKKHSELCVELNMDTSTTQASWDSYESIRQNYTLDGDQLHWLCCSLYVACRKTLTPTVGQSGAVVEGNCVSLTRLLRMCNINFIEFFKKIKKWVEMSSMPEEFRCRIERLERSFAVSMVLFQKFQPIFFDVFVSPSEDTPKQTKSRKHKSVPCNSTRVFELCWSLFVCAKGEFPEISVDLVSSYHMLLCCVDLLFANAFMDGRKDLINTAFIGQSGNMSSPKEGKSEDTPCIMTALCRKHDGNELDAMTTKTYTWKPLVRSFFEKKILKGNENTLTGILDVANFDHNLKALGNLYETYVLSVGEFDERIFFGDNHENGAIVKTEDSSEERIQMHRALTATLAPPTPLTNRKYLPGRSKDQNLTPVSKATQGVARLHTLLEVYKNGPSQFLQEMFKNCADDPQPTLLTRITNMGAEFCNKYYPSAFPLQGEDFSKSRLELSTALYWRLLESILKDELRKKPDTELSNLLNQDIFHKTLFACCLEIVISAHNSMQHKFPWILDCFKLDAFHFYKIIEVVVLNEDKLTRDIVKHLNCVEEQALESMSWASSSPLWYRINASQSPIPLWQEVCLTDDSEAVTSTTMSNPTFRRVSSNTTGVPQSPVSSASERFQSPNTDLARKQLFQDKPTIKPGQSLLNPNNKTYTDNNDRERKCSTSNAAPGTPNKDKTMNNKAGSLGLFFRKFYNLAVVRMQELCNQLKIDDPELKRKIWTCFEHTIVEHVDLMKDRHLDQILMCSVYVICRVSGSELTFTDVMRCYRLQPQAASHVYRSVLVGHSASSSTSNDVGELGMVPSGDLAGTSVEHGQEERGDLIKFYNTVYVVKVKDFAMKFAKSNQQDVPLSPLPVCRSQSTQSRRVSDRHSLFVRNMDHKGFPPSPGPQLTYTISRSPAKDLRAINAMLCKEMGLGKRRLTDSNISMHNDQQGISPPPVPKMRVLTSPPSIPGQIVMSRRLQGLIVDRQVKSIGQQSNIINN